MRWPRKRGATSVMIRVFIPDNSATNGAGLTGLTSASTNLTIAFIRELDSAGTAYTGANIEAQTTIGTYQAPSSSSKIRFKAVDATNFPGVYELQFHDSATAFGSGDTSQHVAINIFEASTSALKIGPNMVLIPLVPNDYQDGVRLGLTSLPNAAAGASGGLPLSADASGRVDVLKINGTSQTARDIGASVLVGDKTGFELSSNGIQAIWNALTSALTTASSIGKLLVDNINATIGSRSTYAGADTSGTTTLLTRIASALTITTGKVDVNDKTGFALTSGEHVNIAADTQTGLTAQGYTTTRAGYLDTLNGLVQAIWDKATSALTTVGSIGKLLVDNINATISSRSTYAGGDTSGTTTLLTRIASALTITSGKVDVNDKTDFELSNSEHPKIATDTQTGLTAQGYTSARADLIDDISNIPDTVWDVTIAGHLTAGTTGEKLNAAEPQSADDIAETLLKLDISTVTGEADRSVLNALRFLRNKWTLTGNTLSVKKEDDTTEAWTAEVSTDPAAEPITGSDPA